VGALPGNIAAAVKAHEDTCSNHELVSRVRPSPIAEASDR
jgi:hypothetical protein